MFKHYENLIDGEWLAGASVNINTNPSDQSDVIGEYAQADATQAETAVAAARRAFGAWSRSPVEVRANLLDAVGNELLQRREELGRLLSREEGVRTRAVRNRTLRSNGT